MTIGEANKLYTEGFYDAMCEVGRIITNSTKDGLSIEDAMIIINDVTSLIHDARNAVTLTEEGE
jgi:hypothetical protein